jgi:tetratricopeptide (TPR) repeat protein
MKLGHNSPLLIFFFLIPIANPISAQTDYFKPSNVYQFAEHLFSEQDYIRAANEYERYLFCTDSSLHSDSLLLKIGICYRLGNQYDKALACFQKVSITDPNNPLKSKLCYQSALTFFEMRRYDESLLSLNSCLAQLSSDQSEFHVLLGIDHLFLLNWREARRIFSASSSNRSTDSIKTTLCSIAIEGENLPYKSYLLAGLLSATIPGAGKIYADRSIDGLYSLLTVGITGLQAYDGFRKDGSKSTKGWIYGILCGGFYLGNIYGSLVSVKIYNASLETNLLHKAGAIISVSLR